MEEDTEVVEMEFEGLEPQDSDITSMSLLLKQLVTESGVDSEELAKLLVSQNYIGTVLKPIEDELDEDDSLDESPVFSITTIVNISHRKEPVVKAILDFIMKSTRSKEVRLGKGTTTFQEFPFAGDEKAIGLFLKQRMVNMPTKLLYPSLLSLQTDLQNAVKKGMPYKFTHFLYWCKMFKNGEEFQHIDSEDEWFEGNSLDYFTYPLKFADTVALDDAEAAPQFRRVYILDFSKFQAFIDYTETINMS